jgi:hypothetical protein
VIFANVRVTSCNVHHFVIRLYLNFRRKIFGIRTRIRGAVNAGVSQSRHKFTDIHIHAATVAYARLG